MFSIRKEEGALVCERCTLADSPFARLRGLLGRKELPLGEGMMLRPEKSIHTWFMRFPIDVVFLAADLTVLGVRTNVHPWRVLGWRGANSVLELPAGTCERHGIRPGERLSLADASDEQAEILLLVHDGGERRVVVNGRGPLSATARTVNAISDLDLPIGVVVLPDEPPRDDSSR
jgi:uncharacterized protein